MFGMFNKAKKVQNRQVMEAVVAACLLMAASDGAIARPEIDKMNKMLQANDLLEAFSARDINKVVAKYESILEADFDLGKKKMKDEISDISDNDDHCEEVMLAALAIAKADGKIEDPEIAVAREICQLLRLNPKDFGLAA